MLRYSTIDKFKDYDITQTDLIIDNKEVFILQKGLNEQNSVTSYRETSILLYDFIHSSFDIIALKPNISKITKVLCMQKLFYIINNDNNHITFYSFDVLSRKERLVTQITTSNFIGKDFSWDEMGIFGLSMEYAVFTLPYIRGGTLYFLLDEKNQTFYKINTQISEDIEKLFSLEIDGEIFVVLKKGQVTFSEKRYQLQYGQSPSKEMIYVINLQSFVSLILNDNLISSNYLIEHVEPNQNIQKLIKFKEFILYTIVDVELNTTFFIWYNPKKKEKRVETFQSIYLNTLCVNNKIYTIDISDKNNKIIEVNSKKEIYSLEENEAVIYLNDHYILTYIFSPTGNWDILLYNIDNHTKQSIGQGRPYFNFETEVLTIF